MTISAVNANGKSESATLEGFTLKVAELQLGESTRGPFQQATIYRRLFREKVLRKAFLCLKYRLNYVWRKCANKMLVKLTKGTTAYKWVGSDYRWPRENLACLSKKKKFIVSETDPDFPHDQR